MERSGAVLLVLFAALTGYFGYRILKERRRLRKVVGLLGDADAGLIQSLEATVYGPPLATILA